MLSLPWLSLLIWTSIGGGLLVLACRQRHLLAKWLALGLTVVTLLMCAPLFLDFEPGMAGMQFSEHIAWIPQYHINYDLGVDGISLPLILLTVLTTLIVILASWHSVTKQVSTYYAIFLLLQGLIIGVFSALDAILFYFFWEAMLIPMYLCIGIWGGRNRFYAAIKFFLYTFLGSVLMLAALIYLGMKAGSFNLASFYQLPLSLWAQKLIFIGFWFAFAVKIPMWPVHTWLPDAHTEAPTGGSVILAAILLKLGAYGLMRFSLPIVPDASAAYALPMVVLSLIGIVGIGLVAMAQTDMKRLIAYSSVAHMGFVTLGIFGIYLITSPAGASLGYEGAYMQMVSHAFVSSGMFIGFGMLYDRMRTRDISEYGGIAAVMPVFAAFYMLFVMANVALPGTSGFVGEFMVIVASLQAHIGIAVTAGLTLVIGAAYTLLMFKRVFYGPIHYDTVASLKDIGGLDRVVLLSLAVMILGLGIMPETLLHWVHSSANHMIQLSLSHKPG